MRPRVNTEKHYVQWTITPIATNTLVTEDIATAVAIEDKNLNTEVREGAIVSAIYVEVWVIGQSDSVSGNFLASLYKQPGVGTGMVQAEHIALNDYDNKKNILYHTQGIINDGVADAIPFIRQWFKIPKGKQRLGLNDRWKLALSTQAEAANYCGFATYKEQF